MIRLGTGILAAGFLILLFPGGGHSQAGLLLMGLGCAPIYPSVIHSTPSRFGVELSQAVIGVQMAGAYIGSSLMPPFFGFLADHLGASLYPYYLLVLLVVMASCIRGSSQGNTFKLLYKVHAEIRCGL